jgi:hypothetical protein
MRGLIVVVGIVVTIAVYRHVRISKREAEMGLRVG